MIWSDLCAYLPSPFPCFSFFEHLEIKFIDSSPPTRANAKIVTYLCHLQPGPPWYNPGPPWSTFATSCNFWHRPITIVADKQQSIT